MLLATVFASLASITAATQFSNVIFQKELTNRPKLVLDMDDTLYSSKSEMQAGLINNIRSYVQHVTGCSEMDAASRTADLYNRYGLTIRGLINVFGIKTDDYESFLDARLDYSRITKDEVLGAILQAVDADVIIFTNSGRLHTIHTLTILGIAHLPHMIIFTNYDDPDFVVKPNPKAYELVERAVSATGNRIYFADDNPSNIRAALERGWNAVRIDENVESTVVPCESVQSVETIYKIAQVFPELFQQRDQQESNTATTVIN
jgi:putative hydrolase of the HAD superfamily